MDTVKQMIKDALKAYDNKQIYPFTQNTVMDDLLTGWCPYEDEFIDDFEDEGGEEFVDIIEGLPMYKFYQVPKEKLIAYLETRDWDVFNDFNSRCAGDSDNSFDIDAYMEMLNNKESLDQWRLIYLILENENRRSEPLPDSKWKCLWDLIE